MRADHNIQIDLDRSSGSGMEAAACGRIAWIHIAGRLAIAAASCRQIRFGRALKGGLAFMAFSFSDARVAF